MADFRTVPHGAARLPVDFKTGASNHSATRPFILILDGVLADASYPTDRTLNHT
jgi:hypothetical protein